MPNHRPGIDTLLHALANPTRRAVVERLGRGSATVSELASPFDMALPSFMQHLEVLEEAGVVRSRKSGRVRTVEMVPVPMLELADWLAEQRSVWERRLDQFDDYVRTLKEDM